MISRHPSARSGFSVGICATGDADLEELMNSVFNDARTTDVPLREVTVVASACSGRAVEELQRISRQDPRVHVVIEKERHGKADAINKILGLSSGRFLVLVNSDARPESGAIAKLLSVISSDRTAGVVSANPVPQRVQGLVSSLVDLMWNAHNNCSLMLNHMNISNHSSDELVVVRSSAVGRLPQGLVNDGAFLAATAKRRGYAVKFCAPARVGVNSPKRLADAIGQRRRILFGHTQVWHKVGEPPKTIESLMIFRPATALRVIAKTLAKRPAFLAIMPVAVVTELSAALLSIWDSVRSTRRHEVWRRYA